MWTTRTKLERVFCRWIYFHTQSGFYWSKETASGSGISWAICNSAPRSRQITMPVPHHSLFYRPYALPAAQPTASKHWRHKHWRHTYFHFRSKIFFSPSCGGGSFTMLGKHYKHLIPWLLFALSSEIPVDFPDTSLQFAKPLYVIFEISVS